MCCRGVYSKEPVWVLLLSNTWIKFLENERKNEIGYTRIVLLYRSTLVMVSSNRKALKYTKRWTISRQSEGQNRSFPSLFSLLPWKSFRRVLVGEKKRKSLSRNHLMSIIIATSSMQRFPSSYSSPTCAAKSTFPSCLSVDRVLLTSTCASIVLIYFPVLNDNICFLWSFTAVNYKTD